MLQSFALILTSILLSVLGQYALKTGAGRLGQVGVESAGRATELALAAAANPWLIGGLACYALGAVTWIMVLTRVPLSWAYPILALNQVLILLVAAFLLGEHVSAMRWGGVLLIVTGVFLVSQS
ncbi:MAG: EamA family transporter [Candidatus Sericytochromatia bacterium]|nr:EamA family transporter [Candidatus Sericytochromatia bacterium]